MAVELGVRYHVKPHAECQSKSVMAFVCCSARTAAALNAIRPGDGKSLPERGSEAILIPGTNTL